MDQALARRMADEIKGSEVGGWLAISLLGFGKSALVFEARKGTQVAALKVFDPDLVQRYGESIQLARIEREKLLIGKSHQNLVSIYDGGKCASTGFLFVAMELIQAKDLSHNIAIVPPEKIRSLIIQLANAAMFLEDNGLVHRDIKPSNIAVSDDFLKLTLLDLGVLRPVGESSLTDTDGRHFVGTLQYSSPEFLYRTEEQNVEGWRALTFYQIGAVLHDLIKGKPIFDEYCNPYARMVDAVKQIVPDLDVPGADPDLVALATSCLVKDPKRRLELVSWESFIHKPLPISAAAIRERIRIRQASIRQSATGFEKFRPEHSFVLKDVLERTSRIVRDECIDNSSVFPPVELHVKELNESKSIAFLAAFPDSMDKGLKSPFALLYQVRLLDQESKVIEIGVSGALSSNLHEFNIDAFPSSQIFYKGPVVEELIRRNISYSLYSALESATSPLSQEVSGVVPLMFNAIESEESQ